jgi:hypothetical protein
MPSFVQMPPEDFRALADALDARPVVPQVVLGCPCQRPKPKHVSSCRYHHGDRCASQPMCEGAPHNSPEVMAEVPVPSFADFLDERPARFAEVFVDMGGGCDG